VPALGVRGERHRAARGNTRQADRPRGAKGVLADAAQILLGVTLSCCLGLIALMALGGAIVLVMYLAK
jgi:hypothetical protein